MRGSEESQLGSGPGGVGREGKHCIETRCLIVGTFEEWDPDAWPLGTTSPGGEFPSLGDGELEASWW